MELTQIRYFLEVASSQHVTRSAEKLHIAQPALTQAIRRLERELNVPLFAARGRNIVLTEYGRFLQKKLSPLVEAWDQIPEQLRIMARLETETIHLNVLAASTHVIDAIIAYKRDHGDVHFQLLQNAQSDLFDIGITTKLFYRPPEERRNEFVCTERIYLAVPEGGKYGGRTSVRLSDVAGENFVSLMGSKQFRWICDKFCRQEGIEPNVVFESDSPSAVKDMIANNMGVGFWPRFTWGSVDSRGIRLLRIEGVDCQRDIVFVMQKNKRDSRRVEEFFQFLHDYTWKKIIDGYR